MHLSPDPSRQLRAASPGRRIQLGDCSLQLDRGHVAVVNWPDPAALASQLAALSQLEAPVVRYATGPLIDDLSLQDNLMLESSLHDGRPPMQLLPEIKAFFEFTDSPLDWAAWAGTWPQAATQQELMQVRVGRALMADPDLLLIDASHWDDDLLHPLYFSQRFVTRYPWRTLVWATHDVTRADALRDLLDECLQPLATP